MGSLRAVSRWRPSTRVELNIQAVGRCLTASQFDQVVGAHGPHQTPSRHGGLPTACCPASGAASIRRDMKHRVPSATQWVFESSNLQFTSFLDGQPAAPGKPQHVGSPWLVVSHDHRCSLSRLKVRREQTTPPMWAVAGYSRSSEYVRLEK